MGHARAIINVDSADSQLYIFKKTLSEDLSVRRVEELAREVMTRSQNEEKVKAETSVPKEINHLQSRLSSHFGTKVSVKSDGKKGDIRIPFLSVEDLNRILDILKV